MKSLASLLPVLLLAALIAACGKSDSGTVTPPDTSLHPTDTNAIVPIKPGNTWYGYYAQYDEYGNIQKEGPDTTRIERDTVIGGETWYIINTPLLTLYANRSDGFYLWPVWIGTQARPGLDAKFPAKTGDTFELKKKPYSDDNGGVVDTLLTYFQVGPLDTTITVRAGTFRCIEYVEYERGLRGNIPDSVLRRPNLYFFSRGIGFIKRDLYGPPVQNLSSLILHWELTSAILK
jgi:hypothetical protein